MNFYPCVRRIKLNVINFSSTYHQSSCPAMGNDLSVGAPLTPIQLEALEVVNNWVTRHPNSGISSLVQNNYHCMSAAITSAQESFYPMNEILEQLFALKTCITVTFKHAKMCVCGPSLSVAFSEGQIVLREHGDMLRPFKFVIASFNSLSDFIEFFDMNHEALNECKVSDRHHVYLFNERTEYAKNGDLVRQRTKYLVDGNFLSAPKRSDVSTN